MLDLLCEAQSVSMHKLVLGVWVHAYQRKIGTLR